MKKRTLRFRKTALTLILSAGIVSAMSMHTAASAQTKHTPAKLYYIAQHDKDGTALIFSEKNKKKKAKRSADELLADIIGTTPEDIKKQRSEGMSLEELADAHNAGEEFHTAIMQERNAQLKKLLLKGRISANEYIQQYNNEDFIALPSYELNMRRHKEDANDRGGDTAELLAKALNKPIENVNLRLYAGENPWEIARQSGKFEEYKNALLENLIYTLDAQVSNGTLTREEADEYIADFEFDFVQND